MAWYHKNKGTAGALAGFAAGSVVPGLGNIIGAVIGSFVGPMVINDEPADEMAWFLEQAGYLHIKGLYTQAEMTAVSIDMDIAAPRYFDGDGRSWWASLKDGTRALVRMQRFDEESRAAADLVADERPVHACRNRRARLQVQHVAVA